MEHPIREIHLTGLARDLAVRTEEKGPVRIGILGAGEMGTDLVAQCRLMRGIKVVAISARHIESAQKAISLGYRDKNIAQETNTESSLTRAIESNQIAITSNELLVTNPLVDVVIDATGKPAVAADFALMAMEHGKHVVTMNVEADVTIGASLKRHADRLGVIYTLGAGDEPSSCMELIEFATALGYRIICAGKGKNNRLDHNATPPECQKEALQRNMNPHMLVEFIDGSKTMVEMAAIANATGLIPDIPGMHGPAADRADLDKVFIPREDGGILSTKGVVDYTIGRDVAPGVFVVVEVEHPRIIERMNDLHIGSGPYYVFFRPYHLTSLEVPLTAARVVLYGRADMSPLQYPVAEVCAKAKRNLQPGEKLDAMGGVSYYAWTMTVHDSRIFGAIPAGLLEGGIVLRHIKKGDLLTADNVAPDQSTKLYSLRQTQDAMLYD